MKSNKFYLRCNNCDFKFDFKEDIFKNQACPSCGDKYIEVAYHDDLVDLAKSVFSRTENKGLWKFLKYLPLNQTPNVIRSEKDISIERLRFLEDIAKKKFNINCNVFGHRFDESVSTGTWKDLSGAMLGSALAENGIKNYVVASTGNIGVAMACYLTLNNVNLYVFIPESSSRAQEAEIASFGQKVIRVNGDYAAAKSMAKAFAAQNDYVYSNGTFDLFRIEAKKTMAFEWLREMDDFPTIYIQALSGGTGPLGVYKGCKELKQKGLISNFPKQILIQTKKCAPMANAWNDAKSKGFTNNWYMNYTPINNPQTGIATLATGNPYAYPVIAQLIEKVGGTITSMDENYAIKIAQIMAKSTSVRIGPAASIGMGGFYRGLKEGEISNNDTVLINIGEGMRRSPSFMSKLSKSVTVSTLDELDRHNVIEEDENYLSNLIDEVVNNV